jgi:hypothetical protein
MGSAVAQEMAELYGLDDEAQVTPWYCPMCDVSVTNDMAYLDHINGVKHLKKIGYSMRVRYVPTHNCSSDFPKQDVMSSFPSSPLA